MMFEHTWHFFVRGQPVTQGSMRAFVVKGRPIITSANKNLKDWRTLVALQAQTEATAECPLDGPFSMTLEFYMPRPKSLKKSIMYPIGARSGDIDKCARAVLDALTSIFYKDDSQVVKLDVQKYWAMTGDVPQPPGVFVEISTNWLDDGNDHQPRGFVEISG